MTEEKVPTDSEIDKFKVKFKILLRESNLCKDQQFNSEKIVKYLCTISKKLFLQKREALANVCMQSKERITILCSWNVWGTSKSKSVNKESNRILACQKSQQPEFSFILQKSMWMAELGKIC